MVSRRYLLSILAAAVLVSSSGFAQQPAPPDLTGTWNGFLAESAGATAGDPATLILKQTGTELTGTGGPRPDRQWPIQKGGKVTTTKEGVSATFTVANDTLTLIFDLKLVEGRLKGTLKGESNGEQRSGIAQFERAKTPRP
jgi:hypothetical protein